MVLSLFSHFWSQFLTKFNVTHSSLSLGLSLQEYYVTIPLGAYKTPKTGKNIQK